jgi:Transcriptional regulator, AbiEi antitoxin, Type IV TA system
LKGAGTVNINEYELIRMAQDAVRRVLQNLPGLEIVRVELPASQGGRSPDLAVDVRSPSVRKRLIIEAKTRGEPRLARAAVNQLQLYRERYGDVYGVFVAPYVSPRAGEICWAEGIGYLDLSGNCRLSFNGIFIEREGKPNKFAEKRDLGTLYSPKATRVLRMLLCEPGKSWRVTELAEAADVSLGLVSNVKKLVADREWTDAGKNGFALSRPLELLQEWSENYSFQQNEAWDYYSMKTAAQVEAALATLCADRDVQYALTAFSAAARMAPAVRYQRAFVYVACPVESIAPVLGLKEVSSGANVTLLSPYDAGVFAAGKEYDGVRTVCPAQAYLDLVTFKGRGEEAAAAILEEVIKPQW